MASNLFKGMNGYFDIVMFDEASQLKLEDTLPALLKGKQIVVAGDEHQMPPSNYFSKIFDSIIFFHLNVDILFQWKCLKIIMIPENFQLNCMV